MKLRCFGGNNIFQMDVFLEQRVCPDENRAAQVCDDDALIAWPSAGNSNFIIIWLVLKDI